MADEILRSRHAFGTLEKVLEAISSGKIDAYDVLFLKDANGKPYIGWVDKDNNPVIIREEEEVIAVDSLPVSGETGKIYIFGSDGYFWNGKEFINLCKPTDVSVFQAELEKLKSGLTDLEAEVAKNAKEVESKLDEITSSINDFESLYRKIKYEITSKPEGTLVDYGEKEIRLMCPSDTVWTKQNVGNTGNANMYYMGFKAYAPEGAVSFKEGDRGVIVDEMFTFDSDFAGTDEFGRNYSICWLALASYDESSKTWNYFGKNSSANKYIGWTYVVEWYNAEGKVIESDSIRINLSNEDCHLTVEPFYVSSVNAEVDEKVEKSFEASKLYTDEQLATAMAEAMAVIEF